MSEFQALLLALIRVRRSPLFLSLARFAPPFRRRNQPQVSTLGRVQPRNSAAPHAVCDEPACDVSNGNGELLVRRWVRQPVLTWGFELAAPGPLRGLSWALPARDESADGSDGRGR